MKIQIIVAPRSHAHTDKLSGIKWVRYFLEVQLNAIVSIEPFQSGISLIGTEPIKLEETNSYGEIKSLWIAFKGHLEQAGELDRNCINIINRGKVHGNQYEPFVCIYDTTNDALKGALDRVNVSSPNAGKVIALLKVFVDRIQRVADVNILHTNPDGTLQFFRTVVRSLRD